MSEEAPKKPWRSADNPWLGKYPESSPSPPSGRPANRAPRQRYKDQNPRPAFRPKPPVDKAATPELKQSIPPPQDPRITPLLSALRGNKPLPRFITPALLTNLVLTQEGTTTPLHIAAKYGRLGDLPAGCLSIAMATTRDVKERTPLHIAIEAGTFQNVPKHLLNRNTVMAVDQCGVSVLDLAFKHGVADRIPPPLRRLSPDYMWIELQDDLRRGHFESPLLNDPAVLSQAPPFAPTASSLAHWLAREGHLSSLPLALQSDLFVALRDQDGKCPVHLAVQHHGFRGLPSSPTIERWLLCCDSKGRSVLHELAGMPNWGGLPVECIHREILLLTTLGGESVADTAFTSGNLLSLPSSLRGLSKLAVLSAFRTMLRDDYLAITAYLEQVDQEVIPHDRLLRIRRDFVREWASRLDPSVQLDSQQAETVAVVGLHVQVTARAGSGKTRCLVTRALFLIKHCGINPRTILILAFNRKAVAEIRKRLAMYLDENDRPHVLTFHSLAWRIVRPSENILFDEEGSDEAKRLSQKIQEIIRSQLRHGTLEKDLRDLMRINWEDSLARIIQKGFDLPEEEFIELRERMHDTTLDGRRVETEAHKWIGDFLLRHGLEYSYRPTVWRQSGKNYSPAFLHVTASGRRVIIEAVGKQKEDAQAAALFWGSDRATSSVSIRLDATDLATRESVAGKLRATFKELGLDLRPLGKKELWERIRDKVIDNFTNSVRGFISRCQKECLWPDPLANLIEARVSASDLQSRFWKLALEIFKLYEQELGDRFTDFDRLMLEAADRIASGGTVFSSESGRSDLRHLTHVLIDEFQDFSLLFDRLRSSMVGVNSEALFFCVGDDWQAINRFAGSNLRYFSGFCSDFRPNRSLEIITNYRSAAKIVALGNQVMNGYGVPSQPKPGAAPGTILLARSAKESELSPEEDSVSDRFGQLAIDLLRLAQMEGMPLHRSGPPRNGVAQEQSKSVVAVLTRTLSLPTPKGMLSLEDWEKGIKKYLREEDRERLEFSTVHGYKGREATAVILVEPENYPLIHPDAVLAEIFGDTYQSLVDDERRLFYVGVTRAEATLILLQTNPDAPIAFLGTTALKQVDVSQLKTNLLIGDEVVVSLRNAPSVREMSAAGTMPLKDILKEPDVGFSWKPQQGAWMRRFPIEDLPDAPAFSTYLRSQRWIGQADQVIARLVADGFQIEFLIIKGQLQRTGAALTGPQKADVDCLPDHLRELIGPLLEHLHLDHGIPWPEMGYEGTNPNGVCDGSMLSIAWPDIKTGIALLGDPVQAFLEGGWSIHSFDGLNSKLLIQGLLREKSEKAVP